MLKKVLSILLSSFGKAHNCVKRVRIQSYSGPHFSHIFPHSDWIRSISPYLVRMRENAGKMWTRITPNTDTFYAVHSTQQVIFRLKWWKKALHKSGYDGTVLMDLSKAYGCIPRDLLIVNLELYGLDKTSLHLLRDYLSNRELRTKIGSSLVTGGN